MKHVFVETNWVVASSAPVHERMPAALELVERAQQGEIRLHLPSICLGEARYPIRSKYQPRTSADAIRKFLAWTALHPRVWPAVLWAVSITPPRLTVSPSWRMRSTCTGA